MSRGTWRQLRRAGRASLGSRSGPGSSWARGRFDLVLGSVHCVLVGDVVLEIDELGSEPEIGPEDLMQAYCDELLRLIEGPV